MRDDLPQSMSGTVQPPIGDIMPGCEVASGSS
jgi:hypothetical protein